MMSARSASPASLSVDSPALPRALRQHFPCLPLLGMPWVDGSRIVPCLPARPAKHAISLSNRVSPTASYLRIQWKYDLFPVTNEGTNSPPFSHQISKPPGPSMGSFLMRKGTLGLAPGFSGFRPPGPRGQIKNRLSRYWCGSGCITHVPRKATRASGGLWASEWPGPDRVSASRPPPRGRQRALP